MNTFFVYLLPIILVFAECVFMRVCANQYNDRKIPRLLVATLLALAFIPIVGLVEAIILPIVLWLMDVKIVDNKFTKFWIKD